MTMYSGGLFLEYLTKFNQRCCYQRTYA